MICAKVVIKKAVINGTTAITLLPNIFIASAVAIADASEFRKLVPMRTVVRRRSIFALSAATFFAFLRPCSTILRSFSRGSERYAVSEEVKKPTHKSRTTSSAQVRIRLNNSLFILLPPVLLF